MSDFTAAEVEAWEYQLSQVKLGLASEPSNAELLAFKDELISIIALAKDSLAAAAVVQPKPAKPAAAAAPKAGPSRASTSASASPAPASASTSAAPFNPQAGDLVQARYSNDGKWYPAKIVSLSGSSAARVYTVLYTGYDNTAAVPIADLKAPTASSMHAAAAAGAKRKATEAEEAEKERKRKKLEKKLATQEVKKAAQDERKSSWQTFAKKAVKKGAHIPGVSGESIFASPDIDNPYGRVGVTGSGKGMSKAAQTKRQTFQSGGADDR